MAKHAAKAAIPKPPKSAADTRKIFAALSTQHPNADTELNFTSAYELLVATILSAQCTDARVNQVTPALFKRYPDARALAKTTTEELEPQFQSTGFFRAKSRSLLGMATKLVDEHEGEVPRTMDELVKLPGVGRKTANVVLGTAFGLATGVVVDTHVSRLSQRLGLTDKKDAVKIERDLMDEMPRKEWVGFSHRMIHHGRQVCVARKPRCEICSMVKFCPQIGVVQKK